MASIQFISGKICYNRKNYFKEVLMESTVFTNLRGSEGALTFNFFCESLITSLHTLTHVMEDAGLAVPDNVGDIADALGEMGSHLMEDYQRGELDLDRFKDEILDFYDLNFAVNDALALAIMSQCSCPRSVLSMLHSASVSGQHSSFSSGRWASSSSLLSTGFNPCWVRTLAMVPPVVMKSRRCLDIKQKPPVAEILT